VQLISIHSRGSSLEIECSGSCGDSVTVVCSNNFVHTHSVTDVVSESSSLYNVQSLLAGTFFFIELSDQVVINSGVFFVLSVFIIQFLVESGQISSSVNDELFSNSDLFFSVVQLFIQIGQLVISFINGVSFFDHISFEVSLSLFFR